MIFVRTGPRFLFLRTNRDEELRNGLITALGGKEIDFTGALEISGESDTIIFIMSSEEENVVHSRARVVFLRLGSSVALTEIINHGLVSLVSRAALGPGLLVQRLPDGGSGIIDIIRQDYRAQPLEFTEAVSQGGPGDTVIIFTRRPLRRSVRVADLMEPALLVNKSVPSVYRELRREAVRYFTEAMENSRWYDVRINIYDADEHYKTHSQRLALVLGDLEAGFILGEAWTRDHALALLSVAAYQVRLFTMMEPLEIKKILVSLEYNAAGKRFVDMDLYHRRQKISWSDVARRLGPEKKSGRFYREELYARLSPDTLERLLELERSIECAD
ncbi:hypothetical protein [Desulfoscipio geothermicus]|uniref:Uncharacterized protein n=1 Tax=Desulfoscipio geothermicus DSM 3669 TaxID=1121426 RepID=A0A1I6EA83_9FIRM|nr:hypothetical protein [Desulfoscipio geothermicus]SFR14547.1 hypothetical protein SAMN05660706_13212 [Desulfoscipio geothermicus DSM 3669]